MVVRTVVKCQLKNRINLQITGKIQHVFACIVYCILVGGIIFIIFILLDKGIQEVAAEASTRVLVDMRQHSPPHNRQSRYYSLIG
jgi:hypothetical protein